MTNFRVLPYHNPPNNPPTASGGDLKVEGIGDLVEELRSDSEQTPGTTRTRIILLKDVLHIPGLASNLLSLRATAVHNFDFYGKGPYITLWWLVSVSSS